MFLMMGGPLDSSALAQDISFSRPNLFHSIDVSATHATRWVQGSYEVLHLVGDVNISQHQHQLSANEAILWVELLEGNDDESEQPPNKVLVYLEGQTVVEIPRNDGKQFDRMVDERWFGRLFTRETVDLNVAAIPLSGPTPAIFARGQQAMTDGIQTSVAQTQFNEPTLPGSTVINPQTGAVQQVVPGQPAVTMDSGAAQPAPAISTVPPTDVQFFARDSQVDLNAKIDTDPVTGDRVFIGTGGVRVVINSPEISAMDEFRSDQQDQIIILADNVVGWQSSALDGSTRWEIYLEGNVVFAKDTRVIYAERMYYDANYNRGTILNAEILTPIDKFDGLVRLKADVVQQLDRNNLQAVGAAFTSSRLGVPRYWLQSEQMTITRSQIPATDPETGDALFDPSTGIQKMEDQYFAEAQANRVYANNIPVFFWPRFRTNLSEPTMYLERFTFGNDSIFGTQLRTGWNMYQLLGIKNPPKGTTWTGLLDYLSERGLGGGGESTYRFDSLFGIPGNVTGVYRSWFIDDRGTDILGRGRGGLVPEEDFRGRIIGQHRHIFYPGFQLRGEVGYISDRNFLEQFYEREWDTQKDALTGLWLERNAGTQSFNLSANYQINDFFTQTSWLPRLDHFIIGQPLFNDRLVWHGRSHFGYGRIRVADPPTDPKDAAKFDPLAWEVDADGIRTGTRQELDLPIQMGPVKLVPYALGDVTYWQEALDGNDLLRGYGQTGIRASVPFWKVDPTIQSTLWNINGLAHKVTFDVDAFYADASQDLGELTLYDSLDDDAQEHFRRRFAFDTFGIMPGGNTPLKYDERTYAFRSGIQSYVTSPTAEIADDLLAIKFGARQRWQTKRGMPGQERIIDWITLDVQTILYPHETRDNFGADFGMFDYDFNWHVGDRFTLVSDGYFDFFSQGLRTASFGMHFGRPEVGNLFLGYRMIEGPISSNVITASLVYRMSEKWGVKALTQVDFGEAGTIGNGINFIYIGESFLWQFGVNADLARDNVGFRFGFEPRFLKKSRIFNPGGVSVGPAGARWLE